MANEVARARWADGETHSHNTLRTARARGVRIGKAACGWRRSPPTIGRLRRGARSRTRRRARRRSAPRGLSGRSNGARLRLSRWSGRGGRLQAPVSPGVSALRRAGAAGAWAAGPGSAFGGGGGGGGASSIGAGGGGGSGGERGGCSHGARRGLLRGRRRKFRRGKWRLLPRVAAGAPPAASEEWRSALARWEPAAASVSGRGLFGRRRFSAGGAGVSAGGASGWMSTTASPGRFGRLRRLQIDDRERGGVKRDDDGDDDRAKHGT